MAKRDIYDAKMAQKRQAFLDAAFDLFSEKGIESVTLEAIAKKSGYGIATLYRHFTNKVNLVVELAAQKWENYIASNNASVSADTIAAWTGAEYLRFYLDSFLDLYRNHKDMLRFNYELNSFLRKAEHDTEQMKSYSSMVEMLDVSFHELYERGMKDGTLNKQNPEKTMFSSTFHIMLAAVTRYAVGLVFVYQDAAEPEMELRMLANMMYREFTVQSGESVNECVDRK